MKYDFGDNRINHSVKVLWRSICIDWREERETQICMKWNFQKVHRLAEKEVKIYRIVESV